MKAPKVNALRNDFRRLRGILKEKPFVQIARIPPTPRTEVTRAGRHTLWELSFTLRCIGKDNLK
jgi:hypothetical protein